ncbi:hypothetical protein [Blackfly microvirus SF02]|uniref:Uncharacterized protein n=1 Tax=Blackfly microvirus SF02 TaxID=2576452 RepID=A0A4P8PK58_9VIRU|nr:hypothetical protein [Blackfly microvirus SF02]
MPLLMSYVLSDTTPLIVVHSTLWNMSTGQLGASTMRRSKMSNRSSQKLFTRTAQKVHSKNNNTMPMRGGIRL